MRHLALYHAEIQGSGGAPAQLAQLLLGDLRQVQHLVRPAQEQLTRLGQLQFSLATDKQLHSQLLLQQLDLMAQRRLAHPQLFRRMGDVQFLGYRYKVA